MRFLFPETPIHRVGTKKMTNMDFHEILPLDQFKSESKELLGYFDANPTQTTNLGHLEKIEFDHPDEGQYSKTNF